MERMHAHQLPRARSALSPECGKDVDPLGEFFHFFGFAHGVGRQLSYLIAVGEYV